MCGFPTGRHEPCSAKLGGRRRSNDQRSASGGRGGPIAGRRPRQWRPSPWGGSARPAKTSTKPTPTSPFRTGNSPNYLRLLFPFSHSSPKGRGGHPYSRRFSATIARFWAESNRTTGKRGTPFSLAFPPGIRILETLPEGAGTISRKRPHKEARHGV